MNHTDAYHDEIRADLQRWRAETKPLAVTDEEGDERWHWANCSCGSTLVRVEEVPHAA